MYYVYYISYLLSVQGPAVTNLILFLWVLGVALEVA